MSIGARYQVVEMPASEGWARLLAIVDNDRDVAGGRPVTGFELDRIEETERVIDAQVAHRMVWVD